MTSFVNLPVYSARKDEHCRPTLLSKKKSVFLTYQSITYYVSYQFLLYSPQQYCWNLCRVQVAEFFLFSGLMCVTTAVFVVMSLFYTYVTPRPLDDDRDSRTTNPQTAAVSPADNWCTRSRQVAARYAGSESSQRSAFINCVDFCSYQPRLSNRKVVKYPEN